MACTPGRKGSLPIKATHGCKTTRGGHKHGNQPDAGMVLDDADAAPLFGFAPRQKSMVSSG